MYKPNLSKKNIFLVLFCIFFVTIAVQVPFAADNEKKAIFGVA